MMDSNFDQMEVDTEQLSRSMTFSCSSDILGKLNLDVLNNNMIALSEKNYWRNRLDVYERIDLILSLFDVLVQLGRELEGLKATVRECAEKNDWTALIVHRTYIWITSIPKMPCLTITLGNMGPFSAADAACVHKRFRIYGMVWWIERVNAWNSGVASIADLSKNYFIF